MKINVLGEVNIFFGLFGLRLTPKKQHMCVLKIVPWDEAFGKEFEALNSVYGVSRTLRKCSCGAQRVDSKTSFI